VRPPPALGRAGVFGRFTTTTRTTRATISAYCTCPAYTRPSTAAGGRSARVEPRVLPILRLAGRRRASLSTSELERDGEDILHACSLEWQCFGAHDNGCPSALVAPGPRRSLAAGWRVYPQASAGLSCSASRRGTEPVRARPALVRCCLPPIPRTRGAAAARDMAYRGPPRPLKPERQFLTLRMSLVSGLNPAQFLAAGRGRRRLKAWQRWQRMMR
jgi:hypothetical protein